MNGRLLTLIVATLCALCPSRAVAQDIVEYYAVDAIGSVRVVFDAAGTVTSRMDYGPFGEQLAPSTMGAKSYAQLFRDGEAGQDYAEARMYHPRTGRFNSPDSVYSGLFQPQAWNRYSYVLNNPLTFTDPTGLQADPCLKSDKDIKAPSPEEEGPIKVTVKCTTGDGGGGGGNSTVFGDLWWFVNTWVDRFTMATRTGSTVPGEDEIVPTGRYTPSQTIQDIDKITLVAAVVSPVVVKAAGAAAAAEAQAAAKVGAGVADQAFHYTFNSAVASIERNGLRAGSYATPNGTLSPLQAHIDLALPPNRGLPDSLVRIDLAGMRQAGYEIPRVNQVGRSFNMPGGGYEMNFPYPVPFQFITVIRR